MVNPLLVVGGGMALVVIGILAMYGFAFRFRIRIEKVVAIVLILAVLLILGGLLLPVLTGT